jgi:hypothetical protein
LDPSGLCTLHCCLRLCCLLLCKLVCLCFTLPQLLVQHLLLGEGLMQLLYSFPAQAWCRKMER